MKKRVLSILLMCCMVLTLLPTTVAAADGPMDTVPTKYDVSIDLYNRTGDVNISDSKTYYIYSSVPDKLRDQWFWKKKIQIKGSSAAPHIFIDGLNIEVSPSAKTPAIEVNGKAKAYLYFIGRDSVLQGATGRAAIQKNRSENQVHILVRTGTTVTCKGGEKAAGIGGSYATRNVFDGLYNGDMYGHGVDIHFGSQSNPDYWGGTVVANGGQGSAGIGAGQGGAGEKLYFYSGTVQATGGRWGSGIGGSYEGRGSEIYIYGGNVIATGVEGGAGIGGGCWKTAQDMNGVNAAHDIYIYGGMVTANGGYNGAGIGGGQYVPAHDITITGGYITANGVYGAAIGGGRWMHGKNITVTDAQLKLSAGRLKYASDAAAMGYGDLVYTPKELVKDPSVATNDAIKIGSKKKGAIVWLKVEAHALAANGRSDFFWNLSDFLIPNERGLIDVSLLTLPFVQNYGWAITELEMIMMETSCEGEHVYGWKDWHGCHVWGCKYCFGRDPTKQGPAPNGKHTPGDWDGQEKKCTVCGVVTTKDTTPPVIEGVVDGRDYDPYDTEDGQPGAISFTVSDPAGENEASSGIKSVTINGVEQTVQAGQIYQLTAPDGGNNDEGLVYEIVVTDNTGNSTTARVRVYRRHRVLFVEDRDRSKKYAEVGTPHGFDLDFPFNLPKEAYFVDLDDESIKIYYNEETKTYHFGIINCDRTFLLVLPTELTVHVGNTSFWDYRADALDEFSYVDPVGKDGEYGYSVTLGISSNQTSYYFGTTARYTLEQLKELDDKGGITWYRYDPEAWFTFIGPSFEDYHGEWYVYAKATNEQGTKYVSSPRLILDCEDPLAIVYPSGRELEGKANSSAAGTEGKTYWGDLQFKVHDDTPVTVQDGKTVLEPDENGIYTIPADMDDNVYHNIYIRDACGNTIFYLRNKVRLNTLERRDNPGDLKLSHGAVLADELPETVVIYTAAGGTTGISVPVIWEIPDEYNPAAKQEQSFTVNGTLDLSGTDIVVNPKKAYWQNARINVTVAAAAQYRVTITGSENGTVTATNAVETAADGTPLFYENDLVMLSIDPDEGYMLSTLSINGTPASVSAEDDTYTFRQPGENVTVTATFEQRIDHTVTFDANGGSEPGELPEGVTTAMPAKRILHNSAYYLPECEFVAPQGKQFKAWQIGDTEYPVNAPVTVTADITVKALWESTHYDVTVTNDGNGTASANPSAAAAGTEITLTATPNTGYHFKEWQVVSGDVTIVNNKFTMPDGNVEIKAIFEQDAPPTPDEYTVTVTNDGNGTASANPSAAAAGTEITLTTTPNTGYHFKEWQVVSGDVTIVNNKFTMPDGNVRIKAIFEEDAPPTPDEYTVTVTNDGNGTASASPAKATAGTEITLTAAPKTGYHFKEWQVLSGSVTIVNNKFTMPDSNVEIKAIFEQDAPPAPDEYTVTVTNDGNGTASANLSAAAAGTEITLTATPNAGYHFKEWQVISGNVTIVNGKFTMPDGNVDIKAIFEEDAPHAPTDFTVTVTTDGNGTASANPSAAAAGTEITLAATPNTGYHFKEWQVISGGVTIVNNKFTMPDGNVRIKAIFEEDAPPAPTEYTVTVINDGNGTASANPSAAAAGTEITLTATPNNGYHFKEWQVLSGSVTIVNNKFTMPDSNVEIKAIFEQDAPPAPDEYTVTVTNDGNGTASANPSAAAAGTEITLTATPNTGYHFKEWQVISGDVTIVNGKFTMPDGNVEIKAIFEEDAPHAPTDFTVTFDGNGGTPSVGSMTTTDGKLASLPSASRSGYRFDGWYTEKTGGTKVTTETLFSGDTTVYARWHAIKNTGNTSTGTGSGDKTGTKRLESPRTGDSGMLGVWSISLCTSLAGCLTLAAWRRRRRGEEVLQSNEK